MNTSVSVSNSKTGTPRSLRIVVGAGAEAGVCGPCESGAPVPNWLWTRKPLKTRASEREVQRAVVEAFALFGCVAERRNVGAAVNPKGRLVTFGTPGDSDLTGIFPAWFGPASGKRFDVEVKAEGFEPAKCYGKARARFELQLERLKRVNSAGGYAWWTSDAEEVVRWLDLIRRGWIVRIASDEVSEIVEVER